MTTTKQARTVPASKLYHEDFEQESSLDECQKRHEHVRHEFMHRKLSTKSRPNSIRVGWWIGKVGIAGLLTDLDSVHIDPYVPAPLDDLTCVVVGAQPLAAKSAATNWQTAAMESPVSYIDGLHIFGDDNASYYETEGPAYRDQLMFSATDRAQLLKSPLSGPLRILRSVRHVDITVDSVTVIRIPVDTTHELLRNSGHVNAGQPLVRLPERGLVGLARLSQNSRNRRWRHLPPVLAASRQHMLRFVDDTLEQFTASLDGTPVGSLPVESLMPRLVSVLTFSQAAALLLDMQVVLDCASFRCALLQAVGPDGDFAVRAPADGVLEAVASSDDFVHRCRVGDHEIRMPASCSAHMHVAYGDSVKTGQVIADYTTRIGQDWNSFADSTAAWLYWIAQDFLRSHMGSASTLPYEWLAGTHYAGSPMVDFSDMAEYLDQESGWIAPPLLCVPNAISTLKRGALQLRLDTLRRPK